MSACPLDNVEHFLRRFIVYPSDHAATAHVLWIAHTHIVACFDTTPRLAFMSAEKASGKTRALEVTALFVPNPKLSFSASAAALVRIIAKGYEDRVIPTVLYDEIDNVFCRNEEGVGDLRAALNAGYRRGAKAIRCTNHGASVTEYQCFAPLAIAGLKKLPDTLASRSIFIRMKKAAPDEEKESFRLKYHPAEAEGLCEVLAQWCGAIQAEDDIPDPAMPPGITDRSADCWEPLLVVADFAGGDWPDRARAAAIYLTDTAAEDAVSAGVELLRHIRGVFGTDDKLHTVTLLARLIGMDESPWADIRGKPLHDRGLSDRLKPYGIAPRGVKIHGKTLKGYQRAFFEDAWKRYLPEPAGGDVTAVTPVTELTNKNNLVTPVTAVTAGRPESEPCRACDGLGCPTCEPERFGLPPRRKGGAR